MSEWRCQNLPCSYVGTRLVQFGVAGWGPDTLRLNNWGLNVQSSTHLLFWLAIPRGGPAEGPFGWLSKGQRWWLPAVFLQGIWLLSSSHLRFPFFITNIHSYIHVEAFFTKDCIWLNQLSIPLPSLWLINHLILLLPKCPPRKYHAKNNHYSSHMTVPKINAERKYCVPFN